MKIGTYTIGKCPAIIKKTYLPRSINRVDYETDFDSISDLFESMYALRDCIGDVYSVDGQKYQLVAVDIVEGIENIKKELTAHI